jgi:hypothetical protein
MFFQLLRFSSSEKRTGRPAANRPPAEFLTRWARTAALLAILQTLFVQPLLASTIAFQTDAQLIAMSERVVHARAIAQRSVMAGPDGQTIYTVTTLSVIEDFTGQPGDTIEVWELGGVAGDRILYVGGAVEYQSGQEVLVCLARGPRGLRSVAMGFSKFDVRRQPGGGAALVRNVAGAMILGGNTPAAERSLDEFRQLAAQVTGRPARRAAAPGAMTASQPFTKIVGEPGWRWREADLRVPVHYYRNLSAPPPLLSGGDAVSEIQTALSAWTNPASGSIILQYAGTALEADPKGGWTGIPAQSALITFEDPDEEIGGPVLAIGGGMATVGTGGTVGGTVYDGFVSGFVIFQNAVDLSLSFRQPLDFTRVMTHEVGHTIGLGHTQPDGTVVNPTANIMYSTCCFTETPVPPALGPDDLLGLSTVYPAMAASGPSMTLDTTSLRFGAVTSGAAIVVVTSPQTVRLSQAGTGTVTWTATPTQPWLQVTPTSGTGAATLSVSVVAGGGLPGSGTVDGAISFSYSGASNAPGPVSIRLTLSSNGMSSVPFGYVDTPVDNTTGATGAVPFTGWALDDIEIDQVTICRAAVAGEPAPVDANCGSAAQIFVGTAVFIEGMRTDVQAAFPTFPRNSSGGWGFLVLTNTLPNQGNGNFVFYVYARDRDGHVTPLGTRTLGCDNANATLPFGSIDTPGQGETVSGEAYVNFGWALTQQPKIIPVNGSTISVSVDGLVLGNVSYGHPRADIAAIFPGYANSDGPVGFRMIDTTALTNGLHTIVWTATDSAGATGGIGSRFFRVLNAPGSSSGTAPALAAASSLATASSAAVSSTTAETIDALPLDRRAVVGRRGWAEDAAIRSYAAGGSGRIVIRGEEIDRFEVWLADGLAAGEHYTGALRAGRELMPLPVGSQLHPSTGTFVWSPGVGFVGAYDLVFVRWSGALPVSRQDVRIVIAPKGSGRVGTQVVIEAPRSQQDVGQPFQLTGWAADLDSPAGTGVSTLHVWAYPLAGGPPVFLGLPALGGIRPDVAAIHGDHFRTSGFALAAQGLVPGHYDLAVFPWSTEIGNFAAPSIVRITVR